MCVCSRAHTSVTMFQKRKEETVGGSHICVLYIDAHLIFCRVQASYVGTMSLIFGEGFPKLDTHYPCNMLCSTYYFVRKLNLEFLTRSSIDLFFFI